MKTEEELKTLKEEVEAVNAGFNELSEDELTQVTGGAVVMHVPVHATCEVIARSHDTRRVEADTIKLKDKN